MIGIGNGLTLAEMKSLVDRITISLPESPRQEFLSGRRTRVPENGVQVALRRYGEEQRGRLIVRCGETVYILTEKQDESGRLYCELTQDGKSIDGEQHEVYQNLYSAFPGHSK